MLVSNNHKYIMIKLNMSSIKNNCKINYKNLFTSVNRIKLKINNIVNLILIKNSNMLKLTNLIAS